MSPKIHALLELQNVTLFEYRVFVDLINGKNKMRAYWIRVDIKSSETVLIREKKHREEGIVKMEAETGVMCL